jgi:hypothetical protein
MSELESLVIDILTKVEERLAAGLQACPPLFVHQLAWFITSIADADFNLRRLEIWREVRSILRRPPRFLIKIDFLKSYHPSHESIILLAPNVGNMEPVEDIIIMREFAGTNVVSLPCKRHSLA